MFDIDRAATVPQSGHLFHYPGHSVRRRRRGKAAEEEEEEGRQK